MSGPLILSLHYEEQLDPTVRSELQNLIATLTNWANQINLGQGNLSIDGMGTFLGQPRCRIFKRVSQSIPNSADTIMTWDVASHITSIEEYDEDGLFDGTSYILCKQPGLYIAQAEIGWTLNTTGKRHIGIHPRIPDVDYLGSTESLASTVDIQNITSPFVVSKNNSDTPIPLGIGVRVFQDSGGPLDIVSGNFGVWKVS